MDVMPFITLGIALLGAALGIINTWRSIARDRIKLKIIPKNAIPVGPVAEIYPDALFGIEVINLSMFPVTITEIGFLHKGLQSRAAVIFPIVLDGQKLPRKLESREAASFYMDKPTPRAGKRLTYAYARTSCDRMFKGSSPALKQHNS